MHHMEDKIQTNTPLLYYTSQLCQFQLNVAPVPLMDLSLDSA